MTSVCHEAPQFLFEFWRPAQGVSWPASDSAQDFNGSSHDSFWWLGTGNQLIGFFYQFFLSILYQFGYQFFISFFYQSEICCFLDYQFSFCHQKSQCLSPGLYWLEGSSFLLPSEGPMFSPGLANGWRVLFSFMKGLLLVMTPGVPGPMLSPGLGWLGGLFLLLMTSGLPSEGPTLSLAFRIMIRSGCAVELRSGCAVGLGSGCAVGVRPGCAVGLRSGCAVGLRSGVYPSGVQKNSGILWQLGVTVGLGSGVYPSGVQKFGNPMATRSYRRIGVWRVPVGCSKIRESYGNSELP